MKILKYCIYCRYEHWNSEGKKFTKWFSSNELFDTEDEANAKMKEMKEFVKACDKATKLKHEYEVRYIDETLVMQRRLHRPKGRPKKFTNEELDVIVKALNKNGQTKIDGTTKAYLYNDEDAHKYIQDHLKDKNKWVRYWYDNNDVLYLILKDNTEKIYE